MEVASGKIITRTIFLGTARSIGSVGSIESGTTWTSRSVGSVDEVEEGIAILLLKSIKKIIMVGGIGKLRCSKITS